MILARELEAKPDLLVAVHPTRGLDVGRRTSSIKASSAPGRRLCRLLISADLDEVLQLSTRLSVMYEGKIVGTYPGVDPPIKQISLAMAGKQL